MKVYSDYRQLLQVQDQPERTATQSDPALRAPWRVVVIGNFDGMHRGHRALFAQAEALRAAARAEGKADPGQIVALTFSPHPARVLSPQTAPPLLSSPQRKRELLLECGVDVLIEQRFDRTFAALSPEAFVTEVLTAGLGAHTVCVGYDFTFGKGRAGTIQVLGQLLQAQGIPLHVVPAVTVRLALPTEPAATATASADSSEVRPCSSSLLRKTLAAGQPGAGARLLGRWPEVEGLVVHGAGRGRTIGIPTANLAPTTDALPAVGVYAAWAELLADLPEPPADAATTPVVAQSRAVISRHPAAVNVGYNPTFTAAKTAGDQATMSPLTIEAHLLPPLDSALAHAELPSLYGHTLRLLLVERIRGEQRFPSVSALVERIKTDVAQVRALLSTQGEPGDENSTLLRGNPT